MNNVVQQSMSKDHALRLSFRQFLRSLPVEHAPMNHQHAFGSDHRSGSNNTNGDSSNSAYNRVRTHLCSLIQHDIYSNQGTNSNNFGVASIIEDEGKILDFCIFF